MATRLFVGNLPENTSENDLRTAFSSFGEITTLDLKTKSAPENESKKFAFVSLAASNYNIESCIKHFANEDFNSNRLYVTRARESFLERLQREREQAQKKEAEKLEPQELPKKNPVIKLNEKLNPRKRKFDTQDDHTTHKPGKQERVQPTSPIKKPEIHMLPENETYEFKKHAAQTEKPKAFINNNNNTYYGDGIKVISEPVVDKKKHDSEIKRMESMKKKRQEFKEKQMIIKTGLTAVDKVQNKKIVFSDNEDDTPQSNGHAQAYKRKGNLFDEDDSGDEVDFAVKEQFEGKKGQKVLDLQSRYKSDKRFTLDERFIEDELDNEKEQGEETENVELEQKDEKNKQLDILQDVLGITLKRKVPQEDVINKPKLGMLRFDPSQPEHARFLAPVEPKKQEPTKKGKKKLKEQEETTEEQKPEEVRPKVSKEQFYKVSETLKEAIAQPNTFSLRSLFGNNETVEEESKEDEDYIPLEAAKKPKVKNPFEPKEKNPFVYDSSESENEDETKSERLPMGTETKAVWKESLFFGDADQRLKEGLAFFSNSNEEAHKERRELKSLVKKRIYNKERKNQMFQKKIGGRRKTMKKSIRKKT